MTGTISGFDELRNSAGTLVGPLGFGYSQDWELISRQEVSSVSSVDVFWDADTWDEIEFVCASLETDTDERDILTRLSTDGSTFHSGATDYDSFRHGANTSTDGISANLNSSSMITVLSLGTTGDEVAMCRGTIVDVTNSTVKKIMQWSHSGLLSDGLLNRGDYTGMLVANDNQIRGIQFIGESSATFSGLFIVRGRRKAQSTFTSQDDWVVIEQRENISASADEAFFWPDGVYDEIEVTVWGAEVNSDAQDIELTLSVDGSTFETGASDYEWAHVNNTSSAPTVGGGGDDADAHVPLGPGMGTVADENFDMTFRLMHISSSKHKKGQWTWDGLNSFSSDFNQGRGGFILRNTGTIQGFNIGGQGATTMDIDKVTVRGRRLTPIGVLKQDWEVLQIWDHDVEGDTAEIEFTSIPSQEFEQLELSWENMDTGTTGNGMIMQMSNDNGATWDTGSNYAHAHLNMSPDVAYGEVKSTAATGITIVNAFGSSNVRMAHGWGRFSGMTGTSRPHFYFKSSHINDSGNLRAPVGSGNWFGTGSDGLVTAFRVDLAAGGNFTGGRMILRGRRKAEV